MIIVYPLGLFGLAMIAVGALGLFTGGRAFSGRFGRRRGGWGGGWWP